MSVTPDRPTCPRCGAAMVERHRGTNGSPFWGCSTFPTCRGTRELLAVGEPTSRVRERGIHFDRIVLVCGAVALVVGLGFILAGLNSRPNTYMFLGSVLLVVAAIIVLPSPFLPATFVLAYALKYAVLCVCLAVFFIAWGPASKWIGQYFVDLFMQSIPTYAPATPSLSH